MRSTIDAFRFLVTAPFILLMLVVINWLTSPGDWWVQWAALGMGIAWVLSLFKVVRATIVVGGLSALGLYLWRRENRQHTQHDPNRVG